MINQTLNNSHLNKGSYTQNTWLIRIWFKYSKNILILAAPLLQSIHPCDTTNFLPNAKRQLFNSIKNMDLNNCIPGREWRILCACGKIDSVRVLCVKVAVAKQVLRVGKGNENKTWKGFMCILNNNGMKETKDKIIQFSNVRNWKQFQSVKDLIIGLNFELD